MKLALIRVGLAWILAAPVLLTAAAGPDRPNTLLILADGLGYGSVGCYGGAKVNTPVLDRLAREGRRFTNAYAPGSVCSPSRYGLMHPGRSRKRPEDPRDRTAAQAGRSDEPAHRQGNSVDLGESRQAVLPLFCAERRPRSDFAIGQVYRQPTRDLRELFNLAQDPGETKSVAAENPLEVGAVKPWGLTGQKVFDEGYRLRNRRLADDATWYIGTMPQGYDYAFVHGEPEQFEIESWVGAPSRAVPETGEWTFTRSVRDFVRKFVTLEK